MSTETVRNEAAESLLRQWTGHPNEPEVRIVVEAIQQQERRATVERIREHFTVLRFDERDGTAQFLDFDEAMTVLDGEAAR